MQSVKAGIYLWDVIKLVLLLVLVLLLKKKIANTLKVFERLSFDGILSCTHQIQFTESATWVVLSESCS